ncbi:MAG: Plug domain-containing protein, partial [Alistipes sp.]|nr:Plug domain-containing protein [Alistipes sp.]
MLATAAAWVLLPSSAMAQHDAMRTVDIEGVEIVGYRPLKDIGIQSTKMDSLTLKESISLSVADILTQNTPIFIKSYGRGTMATASMRGTAPSHTKVTWNGMTLNSPMLGMVDFSYIPAYLIDDAALYHGAGSVGVSGGGLGGAVTLSNRPADDDGFSLRYIQGIGSFSTYDEFLRLGYGSRRWQL